MNERIKELIEKTGATKSYIMYVSDDHPERYRVDEHIKIMEAFAESIVRECAELIDNKVTITAAQTYDEVFVAKYDTKELCAQQIKEHFGVE